MTEIVLKAFDLFLSAARSLAAYLPQSGADLIRIFNQFTRLAANLNIWITDSLGINFRRLFAPIGRFLVLGFNYFIDLVAKLVERV